MAYTASLTRTQNRKSWTVIFRHPVAKDRNGNARRVRNGLGTSDETAAHGMVDELNQLLANEEWWSTAARERAEAQFSERVVEIFYGPIETERSNSRAIRDEFMPLPNADSGFRHALLLGATGAGKTSLLRHLIGTDPREERFPTTATGRTTVADMELVADPDADGYEAAITFFPYETVRDHLEECVLSAALSVYRSDPRDRVRESLLIHKDQRFRFNYILGDAKRDEPQDLDFGFDDPEIEDRSGMPELGQLDLEPGTDAVHRLLDAIIARVEAERSEVADLLEHAEDPAEAELFFEEYLDEQLRTDEEVHTAVDAVMDAMVERIDLISDGELRKTHQGWPSSWHGSWSQREAFIREIRRFTSNSKLGFGRLLTPLVDGVRVRGHFQPPRATTPVRLVWLDTEGVGHTAATLTSLSTRFSRLADEANAVVLVDNAEQPMQAGSTAVLEALARSGNASKLVLAYSHFDGVQGDNYVTPNERAAHVHRSVDGVLERVGESLGHYSERALRKRTSAARFFLGHLNERLDPDDEAHRRTLTQLDRLIVAVMSAGERKVLGETMPIYDKANLVIAIHDAAEDFHRKWQAVLGLRPSADIEKEHWARIKALARRFAEKGEDEYRHLRPVADLQAELQAEVVRLLESPREWTNGELADEDRDDLFQDLANKINGRLLHLARERLFEMPQTDWQKAWLFRGPGSTRDRARVIARDIYDSAAPVPTAAANRAANELLDAVLAAVQQVADETGFKLA